MIEYLIDSELGTFSPDHRYNPNAELDMAYVAYATDIRIPIDTSEAYSCLDGRTDDATQRQCS
jgi:hypothetical protein